jgi:hypothetical protein
MVLKMAQVIIKMESGDNTLYAVEKALKEAGFHAHAYDALVRVLSQYKELGSLKCKLEDIAKRWLHVPTTHFTSENVEYRLRMLNEHIHRQDDQLSEQYGELKRLRRLLKRKNQEMEKKNER